MPERKVLYQFSARGHELTQILLGLQLTDAARRRGGLLPLAPAHADARREPRGCGRRAADARAAPSATDATSAWCSTCRAATAPTVLPACGGVGTQYTPAAGWAQAIRYRHETLGDPAYARSIAVVLGGDASTATNGFWSALNIATTLAAAAAVLHRGQRLRHLRAVAAADPRRQHRRQSALLQRPHDPRGRRHRSRAAAALMRRRRPWRGARGARAAAAAAHGAAPVGALRPGHPGLQVARRSLSAERARDPLRRLQRVPGARPDDARAEWTRSRARRAREVEARDRAGTGATAARSARS